MILHKGMYRLRILCGKQPKFAKTFSAPFAMTHSILSNFKFHTSVNIPLIRHARANAPMACDAKPQQ